MRLLLGGIPLGCDNIGDEAILECVVAMLRRLMPGVELTVCTRDQSTARRLGIAAAPLYVFDRSLPEEDFTRLAAQHDAYLWCGATGLSDYPATALRLLRLARQAGRPTLVWGVGMDSTLNPAFFRLRGKRRLVLQALSWLTLRQCDCVGYAERRLASAMRQRIRQELEHGRLVVVRDEETRQELERCGFQCAVAAADTASRLPTDGHAVPPRQPQERRIGFCVSAQRAIGDLDGIRDLWRRLLASPDTRILCIPMNPVTDSRLMGAIRDELPEELRARVLMLDTDLPAQVQGAAASCDAIVSSRLHLLILAGNVRTPIIGVERGSKIRNYLRLFGLTPVCTVDDFDGAAIEAELMRLLSEAGAAAFRQQATLAHEDILRRLAEAEARLQKTLQDIDKN